MIIKSINKLPINKIISNRYLTDSKGECDHKIPFIILKEVNKEIYIENCKLENNPIGIILPNDHFYLISID